MRLFPVSIWRDRIEDLIPTLEREVDEQGNIVNALFAFGQFSEEKEALPTLGSHALQGDGKRIHVTFCHGTSSYHPNGAHPLESA